MVIDNELYMRWLINFSTQRILALHASIHQVICGGISMSSLSVIERKEQLIVKVIMPSIAYEQLRVVLNHQQLSLFTVLSQGKNEERILCPLHVHSITLPMRVNGGNIIALFKGGQLEMIIPLVESRESSASSVSVIQLK